VMGFFDLLQKCMDTSAKCKNNDYLFNAFLRSKVVIQNVVTFFKLTSFTNAVICSNRILKSKRLIYECDFTYSRIFK